MVPKKHEIKPESDKPEERDDDTPHDEDRGGFTLSGPIGFGAEFPESVARESRWIIRAIAIAIPILATLYGLSWFL